LNPRRREVAKQRLTTELVAEQSEQSPKHAPLHGERSFCARLCGEAFEVVADVVGERLPKFISAMDCIGVDQPGAYAVYLLRPTGEDLGSIAPVCRACRTLASVTVGVEVLSDPTLGLWVLPK